jgi:hypothetical protein
VLHDWVTPAALLLLTHLAAMKSITSSIITLPILDECCGINWQA